MSTKQPIEAKIVEFFETESPSTVAAVFKIVRAIVVKRRVLLETTPKPTKKPVIETTDLRAAK